MYISRYLAVKYASASKLEMAVELQALREDGLLCICATGQPVQAYMYGIHVSLEASSYPRAHMTRWVDMKRDQRMCRDQRSIPHMSASVSCASCSWYHTQTTHITHTSQTHHTHITHTPHTYIRGLAPGMTHT